MAEPRDYDAAPETVNREQDDGEQAQDVAAEALGQGDPSEDSEHVGGGDRYGLDADDAQDVVDHMEAMVADGRIDNDAFRGERNDDDEPDALGPDGLEDGDIDLAGDSGMRGDGLGEHAKP